MYSELIGHLAIPSGASTESLGSAAVIKRHVIMLGCKVRKFMFYVSTATVSSGNIVVALKKRSAYGVTSGEVTLDTLVIPTGVAAGTIYYANLDSADLLPGNELVVEVTTAAAGGGAAGAGFSGVDLYHGPEEAVNVSAMVLSA